MCMGTVVCCEATLLGDTFVTTGAGKGLIFSVDILLCIWVSRLEEGFFCTRRFKRDCLLYVFSSVFLEASRPGERHVTTGARKDLKGSLVLILVAGLGENSCLIGSRKKTYLLYSSSDVSLGY